MPNFKSNKKANPSPKREPSVDTYGQKVVKAPSKLTPIVGGPKRK